MHRLWYCTMIAFAFLYFYSKFLWQASFVLTGLAFVFVTELVMLLVWELPTPGGLRPLPLQLGAGESWVKSAPHAYADRGWAWGLLALLSRNRNGDTSVQRAHGLLEGNG